MKNGDPLKSAGFFGDPGPQRGKGGFFESPGLDGPHQINPPKKSNPSQDQVDHPPLFRTILQLD